MSAIKKLLLLLLRSFFIALAIVIAGTFLFFSPPVLTTCIPSLILCPPPASADISLESLNGIKAENLYFANEKNGSRLHACFFKSADPGARVLLFNHGNGSSLGQNSLAITRFLKAGLSVFIFDYEGFGKSSGKPNVSSCLSDAESAYDYLRKVRAIPESRIIIYGQSFGGSVACQLLANSNEAAGLIVESSFSSLLSVARKKIEFFKIYPECMTPIPALNSAAVLAKNQVPLLLIHGRHDQVIPFTEAEINFANARSPKDFLELPNSDHCLNQKDESLYEKRLASYLRKLPSQKSS